MDIAPHPLPALYGAVHWRQSGRRQSTRTRMRPRAGPPHALASAAHAQAKRHRSPRPATHARAQGHHGPRRRLGRRRVAYCRVDLKRQTRTASGLPAGPSGRLGWHGSPRRRGMPSRAADSGPEQPSESATRTRDSHPSRGRSGSGEGRRGRTTSACGGGGGARENDGAAAAARDGQFPCERRARVPRLRDRRRGDGGLRLGYVKGHAPGHCEPGRIHSTPWPPTRIRLGYGGLRLGYVRGAL
jgi:hypothetical protein